MLAISGVLDNRRPPRTAAPRRTPGGPPAASARRGLTLIEILLALGLLVVLVGVAMPNLIRTLEAARLPQSAEQLRGLIGLTRANAMFDGLRYRIRFPGADELDELGDARQPIVEVEDRPLKDPEQYRPVMASWARDETLKRGIRCAEVRLGKPTVTQLLGEVDSEADEIQEEIEEDLGERFEEGLPPLIIEPDGTSEWATFVLTDAPEEVSAEELIPDERAHGMLEVILDGLIGLAWIQRPLYEDELLMMQEHNWPPVMRKDFVDPVPLTEDNVLEIQESRVRRGDR